MVAVAHTGYVLVTDQSPESVSRNQLVKVLIARNHIKVHKQHDTLGFSIIHPYTEHHVSANRSNVRNASAQFLAVHMAAQSRCKRLCKLASRLFKRFGCAGVHILAYLRFRTCLIFRKKCQLRVNLLFLAHKLFFYGIHLTEQVCHLFLLLFTIRLVLLLSAFCTFQLLGRLGCFRNAVDLFNSGRQLLDVVPITYFIDHWSHACIKHRRTVGFKLIDSGFLALVKDLFTDTEAVY